MSKKPQPQKAENPKVKIQTVDQQNEPFLRALQKKVRNINKKLTEITELQAKDNLKPEQIEKINRKDALIEQRTKIEENASFFKQVYAENAAHYRNSQLKELEILARAISIYHTAPQIPEHARLSNLWKDIEQHENHQNLNAAITSLANTLKEAANDRKLQKALTTYIQKHGNDQIKHVEINQEKIVNDILDEKPKVQEIKVEEPPAKVQVVPIQPQPQALVVENKPESVVEKAPEAPQVIVQQEATPIVPEVVAQATSQQPSQQPVEEKKQGERRDYRNRDNKDNRDRPFRGKGNYRGNNRDTREGEGEKRQYKPKFEEKKGEEVQAEDSDNSASSEQARQFRRDQIKKLEDDGFTVIGKPKPKNTQEQLRHHEKQHGKKYHHHNRADKN